MSKQTESRLAIVYCVTSYGKLVGVFANAEDAFQVQMQTINKGRLCELAPMPVTYPLDSDNNG